MNIGLPNANLRVESIAMRSRSQLFLTLALVVLQTVAASAHVLHHAVEYAGTHSDCVGDFVSASAVCDTEGHHDEAPHECQNCEFCDATTDEIRNSSVSQSRPLDLEIANPALPVSYTLTQLAITRTIAASPPLAPQALHAISLPLLN